MTRSSKGKRLFAGLVALGFVLGACGSDSGNGATGTTAAPTSPGETTTTAPPDASGAEYGGSIVVGLESETPGWLPGTHLLTNYPARTVVTTFYDSLMKRDAEGVVRPFLAESLESEANLTVWSLKLRPGVLFHDDTPLNAEALKYIFDNHLKAEGSNLLGTLRFVDSLDVVDELTVRYNLSSPDASFPDILTGAAGEPFSPTAVQRLGDDYGANPVGTGPFKFVNWIRDGELVVERNEKYWQEGLPYLDRITFRVITDEEARVASLQSADADAIQTLRQSAVRQVRQIAESGDFVSHDFIGNLAGAQLLNTTRPPLDDVRVRRAIAYAVDQCAILDLLGGCDISPLATQWFSESSPWYSATVANLWPANDPEKAIELLEEYRMDPNRSDGRAPGDPVTLDHQIIPDPSVVEMGLGYKSMWEAVGFEHNMNAVEVAVLLDTGARGDYMINTSRYGNQDDPCTTMRNTFGDPAVSPLNWTRFHTPEIAELIVTLCQNTDFDVRYEALEKIMTILAENVPHTWTGHTPNTVGARADLKNIGGWRFPDGTLGDGHPMTVVQWGQVWLES